MLLNLIWITTLLIKVVNESNRLDNSIGQMTKTMEQSYINGCLNADNKEKSCNEKGREFREEFEGISE